jgi:hypothetical protein
LTARRKRPFAVAGLYFRGEMVVDLDNTSHLLDPGETSVVGVVRLVGGGEPVILGAVGGPDPVVVLAIEER